MMISDEKIQWSLNFSKVVSLYTVYIQYILELESLFHLG